MRLRGLKKIQYCIIDCDDVIDALKNKCENLNNLGYSEFIEKTILVRNVIQSIPPLSLNQLNES